ncbi:hypothetical protein QJS66_20695 [Kocuria rhizophila]|nr:hypothetical protein QJS66_20695 [Kocuria rhizophila]
MGTLLVDRTTAAPVDLPAHNAMLCELDAAAPGSAAAHPAGVEQPGRPGLLLTSAPCGCAASTPELLGLRLSRPGASRGTPSGFRPRRRGHHGHPLPPRFAAEGRFSGQTVALARHVAAS